MDADIVIVGGGVTGLAIAEALHSSGRSYRVLEARQRFGGRVLSRPALAASPAADAIDLGPAWFWPGQRRVAAAVERFGLDVSRQFSSGRTVFQDGSGVVRRDLEMALNPSALRIERGLAQLTDALVARLRPERLSLATTARRIRRRSDGWAVDITQGDAEATIDANVVVLAAPPRLVIETIAIEPALSPSQLAALRRIPTWMAGHAKAVLVYERPFWRDAGLSGDAISHRGPMAQIHDASPNAALESGALFGFIGLGAAARRRLGVESLKAALTRQAEALFGRAAAQPLAVHLQDWAEERFTAAPEDEATPADHPDYGPAGALAPLAAEGLHITATELAPEAGGLLEGAFAAAEHTVKALGRADLGAERRCDA